MPSKKKTSANFFPTKLHNLLENAESRGYANVISWQEGGTSFKVWNPEVFVSTIMPKYFKQSKLKSFQRQLNIYGWKRIGTGKNRGGYFHPSFVQGIPELCLLLKRAPLPEGKEPGEPMTPEPRSLPDCTSMNAMNAINAMNNSMTFGRKNSYVDTEDIHILQNSRNALLSNFNIQIPSEVFQMQKDFSNQGIPSFNDPFDPFGVRGLDSFGHCQNQNQPNMNVAPRVFVGGTGRISEDMHLFADLFRHKDFQIVDEPKAMTGRLSVVRDVFEDKQPQAETESLGACENVFPQKLHFLLQQAEKEGFDHIISWVNDGAAFKVHDSKAFLEKVMPNYFDQSKFESFRRQLNLYGFQRVSRGPSRGIYYHQFFLQSEPSLCQSITRPMGTSTTTGIKC